MITRRNLLKASAGGVLLLGGAAASRSGEVPGGMLNPASIDKYVTPLAVPPVMPASSSAGEAVDRYVVGIRRFRQQILPPGNPPTTVWGYGSKGIFGTPGPTLEARFGRPVQVTWVNELLDKNGDALPHLLPVDPTLHWANPGGGRAKRDSRPSFPTTPGSYRGPVPIVTHLHGGRSAEHSDGFPEAWYLPAARDIPVGYATKGSKYSDFAEMFTTQYGVSWRLGAAVFRYENNQRATTMWYHDHTLGITRLNVYAGLAGFYLLRGGADDLPAGVLPGPTPAFGDPQGTKYYEIPVVIQDRSFAADGSLAYPDSRMAFDRFAGPYIPRSDVPPIWNPEFFGTAMMVNGRTWPVLTVEPRRFRLRFLNGCNSRFLTLKLVTNPHGKRPVPAALPFWQIGSDGGFLTAPVELDTLLLAPAERADVIVDFTGVREGTPLYLINEAPDGAFSSTAGYADPATTGQVMKFTVGRLTGQDTTVPPDRLDLPPVRPIGTPTRTRKLALIERMSSAIPGGGSSALFLGTAEGAVKAQMWSDPVTENPRVGAVETWEFHNFTTDAHPIHVHEVEFRVADRQPFGGAPRPPERWETGSKDTVIAYPNETTRIVALFDRPGLFVWHCHLLEHEDNEMMRPYRISP
ncbi:multicopper oxidase family protein [Rhizohabitans arisaemae]|uniref:multicopper oxidase family protein n=1 Tax=Rhizohabitans arisaemae TaxID=2720610 RepID=UPI0024B2860D|nr:multicopper oxidase [Rhizohabitans arisaemae]